MGGVDQRTDVPITKIAGEPLCAAEAAGTRFERRRFGRPGDAGERECAVEPAVLRNALRQGARFGGAAEQKDGQP